MCTLVNDCPIISHAVVSGFLINLSFGILCFLFALPFLVSFFLFWVFCFCFYWQSYYCFSFKQFSAFALGIGQVLIFALSTFANNDIAT